MTEISTLSPANNAGLLWAYRLDGRGHGTAIESTERRREQTEGFYWYHLQCDTPEAVAWMREEAFDSSVIEALSATETRPRVITIGDGMLIVLRGVNTNPGADPEDLVSLRLWLDKNIVISARKRERRLLSFQDLRQSTDKGDGPRNPSEFVTMLIARIADRIGEVVDRVDEELTEIETRLTEVSAAEMRRRLSASRRQTAALRRYLAPQRDALDTLFRSRGVIAEQDIYILREQSDRMTRYVEDLDLARERALVLQEELQNRIGEQQNARMYILSLVAAIFLPLSFLTGVFGMNVAGLPGTDDPAAFEYLAFAMGGLALALILFMSWKKWL